jgi:hypothetical protein
MDIMHVEMNRNPLSSRPRAILGVLSPLENAFRLIDYLGMDLKHGSWLNMAELELSVLARQCLATRLPDQTAMRAAVTAWVVRRNAALHPIDWQFTTAAQIKFRRLGPAFDT